MELKFSSTCNYSSTSNTVKCCVLQRSELGPHLFSIYTDDVPCSVDISCNVIMYSEGKSVLIANNCYEELKNTST